MQLLKTQCYKPITLYSLVDTPAFEKILLPPSSWEMRWKQVPPKRSWTLRKLNVVVKQITI
jgi:hypothetical protein